MAKTKLQRSALLVQQTIQCNLQDKLLYYPADQAIAELYELSTQQQDRMEKIIAMLDKNLLSPENALIVDYEVNYLRQQLLIKRLIEAGVLAQTVSLPTLPRALLLPACDIEIEQSPFGDTNPSIDEPQSEPVASKQPGLYEHRFFATPNSAALEKGVEQQPLKAGESKRHSRKNLDPEKRKESNKLFARDSRRRKVEKMSTLEQENKALLAENNELRQKNMILEIKLAEMNSFQLGYSLGMLACQDTTSSASLEQTLSTVTSLETLTPTNHGIS